MEIKPTTKESEEFEERIKRSEVTRFYRISRSTLIRLAKKKILKPVGRIGANGEKVYRKKDVEAYQASFVK